MLYDHAQRAVDCAVELDRFGEAFRNEMASRGIHFGKTRIGVNTGQVVVGNFGGSGRFDYTAHGNAINLAARLEQVNKWLGTRVCVADSTVNQCRETEFRPLGTLQPRGKVEKLAVFEPTETCATREHLGVYAHAFSLLKDGNAAAVPALEQLAQIAPNDPIVALHFGRARAGELNVELGAQRG